MKMSTEDEVDLDQVPVFLGEDEKWRQCAWIQWAWSTQAVGRKYGWWEVSETENTPSIAPKLVLTTGVPEEER
jgi:hypothetical protein